MLKTISIVMAMALFVLADGIVLKTGQTRVYKEGDDGSYSSLVGIARSYTRDDVNGTVLDNATSLEWQDNVFVAKSYLEAIIYCNDLSLDGKTDWRFPTLQELWTLVDITYDMPAFDPVFRENLPVNYYYWSSTTYAGDASRAWVINFYSGHHLVFDKNESFEVRCVRSGESR